MIASGHSPRDVWGYTFRQMAAFIALGESRRKLEQANTLSLSTLAARGKEDDLKKTHQELTRGAYD